MLLHSIKILALVGVGISLITGSFTYGEEGSPPDEDQMGQMRGMRHGKGGRPNMGGGSGGVSLGQLNNLVARKEAKVSIEKTKGGIIVKFTSDKDEVSERIQKIGEVIRLTLELEQEEKEAEPPEKK